MSGREPTKDELRIAMEEYKNKGGEIKVLKASPQYDLFNDIERMSDRFKQDGFVHLRSTTKIKVLSYWVNFDE